MSNNYYNNDGLAGLVFIIFAIIFILYLIFIAALFILGTAAAIGAVFGGATAIKNYYHSFKENMIDSNRKK